MTNSFMVSSLYLYLTSLLPTTLLRTLHRRVCTSLLKDGSVKGPRSLDSQCLEPPNTLTVSKFISTWLSSDCLLRFLTKMAELVWPRGISQAHISFFHSYGVLPRSLGWPVAWVTSTPSLTPHVWWLCLSVLDTEVDTPLYRLVPCIFFHTILSEMQQPSQWSCQCFFIMLDNCLVREWISLLWRQRTAAVASLREPGMSQVTS